MLEKLQQQLSMRDQGMLALLGGALLLYVLYQVLLHPLAASNRRLEEQNAAVEKSLASVTQMAAELRTLRQGNSKSATQSENLSQLVDRTVAANNLRMSRFQPGSSGDAQVRLDNMPFDQVLRWLNELESEHGVTIRELVITPASAAGLVNVSARLSRG